MNPVATPYLIKDLSRLSGHSIYTLKFYLKLGLIKESGRSPETRFRYFDETTLDRLSTIRAWRKQRKSLAEIHQFLIPTDGSRLEVEGSRQKHQPPASSLQPPASLLG